MKELSIVLVIIVSMAFWISPKLDTKRQIHDIKNRSVNVTQI